MSLPFVVFEARKYSFEQDNLIEKIIKEFYLPNYYLYNCFMPKIYIYIPQKSKLVNFGIYDKSIGSACSKI